MFLNSFAQDKTVLDTITNKISLMFNKVKYSDNFSCKAELKVRYLSSSNSVLLHFEVPNYDYRFKTTLNDYAIVKFDKKEQTLQNLIASKQNERGNYIFVFKLSKENLLLILSNKLKSITFYFEPNEAYILRELAIHKGFGSDKTLMNPYVNLAKQTVKTIVSKPNKKQYNELIVWLQKLQPAIQ